MSPELVKCYESSRRIARSFTLSPCAAIPFFSSPSPPSGAQCHSGALSLAGFGAALHPVLDDPMAGLAFIVSAIALIGSGAFPLVIES